MPAPRRVDQRRKKKKTPARQQMLQRDDACAHLRRVPGRVRAARWLLEKLPEQLPEQLSERVEPESELVEA